MFDSPTGLVTESAVQARPVADDAVAPMAADTFLLRATRYLRSFSLAEALQRASDVQGFWHPTGFMAFHTDLTFSGMPVRVHCWPRGLRPVEDGHPEMHDHKWQLASKVLAGTYSETVYALERDPDGPFAHYVVGYHSRDDATVVDDGHRYRTVPMVRHRFEVGEVHHLWAGVFHETTIPEDRRVVTVMVTGHEELTSCSLVGRPGFPPGRRVRRPVTPAEFQDALGDLLP